MESQQLATPVLNVTTLPIQSQNSFMCVCVKKT